MAKIRKYKLSWQASDSERVIGYKLYWSKAAEVSYDSKCLKVGNVVEISLPFNVLLSDSPVIFGITAIDKDGNESDMIKMSEPFQLHVPKAPLDLSLTPLDEYKLVDSTKPYPDQLQNLDNIVSDQDDNDDPLADAIESDGDSQLAKMKYYNDIGYPRR